MAYAGGMAHRPQYCEICGKRIERAATGRPRKTCSDRCRQQRRHNPDARVGWKRYNEERTVFCLHCEAPFMQTVAGRKFCSDACRNRHWREKKRTQTKRCPMCGERFSVGRSDQIYCSRTCGNRAREDTRNAKRTLVPTEGTCGVCGAWFRVTGRGKSSQKYCSEVCAKRAQVIKEQQRRVS